MAQSDVIKSQIQFQDRQRDLRESQLAMDKNRLALAVLLFPDFNQNFTVQIEVVHHSEVLFPDFNQNFTVVDDLDLAPPLPAFNDFERAAQTKNPELRVSSASFTWKQMWVRP